MKLAFVIFLLSACFTRAAVINAASGSYADLTNAVGLAVAGDTVLVPAGSNTLSSRVLIQKPITIKGAGIDQTILTWDMSTAVSCVAMITNAIRISGITFTAIVKAGLPDFGIISVSADSYTPWRIDNCKFLNVRHRGIYINGYECGLIDNCTFDEDQDGAIQGMTIFGKEETTWARPPTFGNVTNVFVENCLFDYFAQNDDGIEQYEGGRGVIRFNQFINTGVGLHGLDSSPISQRSSYSLEFYGNVVDVNKTTGIDKIIHLRGGSGVLYSNVYSVTSAFTAYQFALDCYRANRMFGYLNVDGINRQGGFQYMVNFVGGVGVYHDETIGVQDGGTSALTLTDSTKTWTNSEFASGAGLWNITDNSFSDITGGTGTTLTLAGLTGGSDNQMENGDNYGIISGGDPVEGSFYADHNFPIWTFRGTHTGSDNASVLTDSTQTWTINALIGLKVWNLTDNSKGLITANTATTITATLAGGLQNDWDLDDEFVVTSASGTHDGAGNASVLSDSTQAWTVNEFVGRHLWNRSNGSHGYVTANTATTITAVLGEGSERDWDVSDQYVVTDGRQPLDAVGRTGPTLWWGVGEASVSTYLTAVHAYQPRSPWYEWNNTVNGSTNIQFTFNSANYDAGANPSITNVINQNWDYFNDTAKPGYTAFTYPHPSRATNNISPTSATLAALATQTFSSSGGFPTYWFRVSTNNSGGSINSGSGLYTAGTTNGVDTVEAWDAFGNRDIALVTVSATPSIGSGLPVLTRRRR